MAASNFLLLQSSKHSAKGTIICKVNYFHDTILIDSRGQRLFKSQLIQES